MKKVVFLLIVALLSFSIVFALSLKDITSQGSGGSNIFDKFSSVFKKFFGAISTTTTLLEIC